MPNYNPFNREDDPLFAEQVNTYAAPGIEALQEWEAAVAGILYAANTSGSITAAQNLLLQVTNPGGSGRTMYISRIAGSISISGATLTVSRGGTFSGSAVTPVNYNFGSGSVSSMTSQRLAGTLGGSPATLIASILSAGQFSSDYNGRIIVPPGSTISVAIGLGAATASANISWWEY
ncbi:MAG: hypothetical protein K0R57_6127 [Paenibacillaceae bacterium]|jgi:hypothetical protein|nr:hypothetical protein [Paenibacillaceae bacterium]